ncbi:cytochrome B562, partial [Escherichia coli]
SVDSSMNIIPEKIDVNDKVSVDNYKEELKKLQHEINIAKKTVEDGNIESLRESLDKMNDIKLEGRRKFR